MATTYLQRTPSTTSNRKTFTFSAWIKRSQLTANNPNGYHTFFSADQTANNSVRMTFSSDGSNDKLMFYWYTGSMQLQYITNREFRDTNSFYHIVIVFDTTQAISGDRGKLYVNGVEETSFQTAGNPAQNADTSVNLSGVPHQIGNGGGNLYFDGIISHVHFIDGTAYDASAFGEYDANGVWKIKTDVSVTYGTNGFFILKDGNSVTDQSGNGNNFTVASGTLTNTEDCPSNVFATGNPLINGTNGNSNGNLTNASGQSSWETMWTTLAVSSGKWYAEFKPISHSFTYSSAVGITKSEEVKTYNEIVGKVGGVHWQSHGSIYNNNVETESGGSPYSTYGTSDIVGVAMDLDNGKLYFSKNGVWENSGDPTSGATGTGAISISTDTFYHFGFGSYSGTISANFGNGYFGTTAVASAGTNASGIGIFEYDVPSGYTALSTKGLNL